VARLGEILIQQGACTKDAVADALKNQVIFGGRLGTNLLDQGAVKEADLARALSRRHGLPTLHGDLKLDPAAVALLKPDVADRYDAIPYVLQDRKLALLVSDPNDFQMLDEVAFATGKQVHPIVVPEARIWALLRDTYGLDRQLRGIEVDFAGDIHARARPAEPAHKDTAGIDLMDEGAFDQLYGKAGQAGPAPTPIASRSLESAPAGLGRPKLEPAVPASARRFPGAAPTALPPEPPRAPPAAPRAPTPAARPPAARPPVVQPPTPAAPAPAPPVARAPAPPPAAPRSPPEKPTQPAWAASVPPPLPPSAPGAFEPWQTGQKPMPIVAPPEEEVLDLVEEVEAAEVAPAPEAPIPSFPLEIAAEVAAVLSAGPGHVAPAHYVPAAPAARAAEPEPAPVSFDEAVKLLAGVDDRHAIARTVLRYARNKFKRAVLFTVQRGEARGWAGLGEKITPHSVARMRIRLSQPGVVATVSDTRAHFLGPLPKTEANVRLLKGLGGGVPQNAFLVPILALGRVVNVLYADAGKGAAVDSGDLGELLILATRIAQSYEALLSRAGQP
jgi:hypothetical protein